MKIKINIKLITIFFGLILENGFSIGTSQNSSHTQNFTSSNNLLQNNHINYQSNSSTYNSSNSSNSAIPSKNELLQKANAIKNKLQCKPNSIGICQQMDDIIRQIPSADSGIISRSIWPQIQSQQKALGIV